MSRPGPAPASPLERAPPPRPDAPDIALVRGARLTLTLLFCLFVAVSWMPRLATIGGSDIGLGAVLLALMVPTMLLLPRRGRLDSRAATVRIVIIVSIGFVLFWGYLGVYRLDDPFRAGRLFLSLGQGIILILVITEFLTPGAIRLAFAVSVAMFVGVALLSLYEYIGGQSMTITYMQRDRSSGLFKNPNQYGMIAAMVVPFAVALFFQRGTKPIAVVLLAATFLSLLMAASKTNLLLALVLVLITLAYGLVVSGRVLTLIVALPALVLLIGVSGMPLLEFFNPRAVGILTNSVLGGNIHESTVQQRFELWGYSIELMRASPLFGQGTGQQIETVIKAHTHSHNVFLDLGRTTGLPGMAAAIVLLGSCCWLAVHSLVRVATLPGHLATALRGRAIVIGASLAALSYVISNQMSDSLGPSTSVFLWLCVGLMLRRDELLFPGAPLPERSAPTPMVHDAGAPLRVAAAGGPGVRAS